MYKCLTFDTVISSNSNNKTILLRETTHGITFPSVTCPTERVPQSLGGGVHHPDLTRNTPVVAWLRGTPSWHGWGSWLYVLPIQDCSTPCLGLGTPQEGTWDQSLGYLPQKIHRTSGSIMGWRWGTRLPGVNIQTPVKTVPSRRTTPRMAKRKVIKISTLHFRNSRKDCTILRNRKVKREL